MKENIVIPVRIERLKLCTRRTLETAGRLVCIGLFAASAAFAVLAWLVTGANGLLAMGLGGGLMLGLTGVWQLLRRIKRVVGQLQ